MFKHPIKVSDIPPQELQELFLLWQNIRGDKSMPCRKDFRPAAVPSLLPNVSLVDVENDPRRYRFRLVGTATVKAMGRDVTGQYMDQIPGMMTMKERYDWLVENKTPYLYKGQLVWSEKSFLDYYAIGLPFSEDDSTVNLIMYGMYYLFPDHDRTIAP
ncbi:PAS domain-containing protein [Emcibacter sp.]|uniref:PAS domain-containing protein n=1 Tax=Emcibacter sp. TaxID=1979954 RepID=UPI002AA67F69|nr:PAS domain-containing protein [Emcibacter sp.]